MFLTLHDLTIQFESDAAVIDQQWRRLFMGWPIAPSSSTSPEMTLSLTLTDILPPLPDYPPFFKDEERILEVYQGEKDFVRLHYLDGAFVDAPINGNSKRKTQAIGCLTQQALNYGRFEDITFTSLAPMLRRQGYFLVHAFAASKNGRAVLIVGPSGSGKTTTGLSLLLEGWKLLANDALLLLEQSDGIYALATPGSIGIRPKTMDLLPDLKKMVSILSSHDQTDATQNLLDHISWSEPSLVTAVYFPQIERRQRSILSPKNRAVCLAQLMTESVDQWDAAMLPAHMNLLQKLSEQATPYTLHLGTKVTQLPNLLETF